MLVAQLSRETRNDTHTGRLFQWERCKQTNNTDKTNLFFHPKIWNLEVIKSLVVSLICCVIPYQPPTTTTRGGS